MAVGISRNPYWQKWKTAAAFGARACCGGEGEDSLETPVSTESIEQPIKTLGEAVAA